VVHVHTVRRHHAYTLDSFHYIVLCTYDILLTSTFKQGKFLLKPRGGCLLVLSLHFQGDILEIKEAPPPRKGGREVSACHLGEKINKGKTKEGKKVK
jgi:hypothetical protein